ncbi:unnamed protein product [Caenorhabditis sp. 36 PRJEB53466]|nr:unnamed protein product [Caenorhabditis sp. 36 PRJEB53466]
MDSANARDCLTHLARVKLTEREDLAQLNDKLIDIIENVHFMEAEHATLLHDCNLLKTGIQTDSSGINEIFESEIRSVKVVVEGINRNRQQLLAEQNHLAPQVKEAEQQWRHSAKASLGIPREVEEHFERIHKIQAENCLILRKTKYLEKKNLLTKQNNGRIYEQINLMRMRKDQAVSLQQEYVIRNKELLNSIRNMEEDNKRIIMNEHKYFVRDRTVDRHAFRDQLRQGIADIRADYEFKRVKTEQEIRQYAEKQIRDLENNAGETIARDRMREELTIVKRNCQDLQQRVSDTEIRNSHLTQQIELLRLEISENHHSFEISLDSKTKEIDKLREQCTAISLELEKLCDLNIDLQKEIAQYRRLLDDSARSASSVASTFQSTRSTVIHRPPVVPPPVFIPPPRAPSPRFPSPPRHAEDIIHDSSPPSPPSIYKPSRIDSPYRPPRGDITTPFYSGSRSIYPSSGADTTRLPSPAPLPAVSPLPPIAPYQPYEQTKKTVIGGSSHDSKIHLDGGVIGYEETTGIVTGYGSNPSATAHSSSGHYAATGQNSQPYNHRPYESSSSLDKSIQIARYSPYVITSPLPQGARDIGSYETSRTDSIDDENFQRFTRWYKGRVKITDVTPEHITLVNRSATKSAAIGGFKIIHEYGQNSVYVDLPANLVLAPKESFKIYARGAAHERGSVVAEIDLFDTTVHTNTSIRNTSNEVKSWFVYISNTEIGDQHH